MYCYARYTHEFLELRDPMDFERRIFVKRKAAEVLERTLARTPIGRDSKSRSAPRPIPYQPAERTFELTRSMLEVFARVGGIQLSITTKSNLVVRDLDLLKQIAERSRSIGELLADHAEPPACSGFWNRARRVPELRLRALSELAAAGIRCNILMMPMIPGLTDSPAGDREHHRRGPPPRRRRCPLAVAIPETFRRQALPAVYRGPFPQLAEQMKNRYGRSTYGPRAYDQQLEELVHRLKRKYGYLPRREGPPASTPPRPASQLSLGLR